MSLMQRMMSVLLYGHAAYKQVCLTLLMKFPCAIFVVKIYRYLQPFMICMSPSHTFKIIDDLTDAYDVTVLQWSNRLKEIFRVT